MHAVSCRVSSAQLTLLETVMRKMERVDVWLLNSGGGHSLNPFSVSNICIYPPPGLSALQGSMCVWDQVVMLFYLFLYLFLLIIVASMPSSRPY